MSLALVLTGTLALLGGLILAIRRGRFRWMPAIICCAACIAAMAGARMAIAEGELDYVLHVTAATLATVIFVAALGAATMEHRWPVNKNYTMLAGFGAMLILYIGYVRLDVEKIKHVGEEIVHEIVNTGGFVMGALLLVEFLTALGVIFLIYSWVYFCTTSRRLQSLPLVGGLFSRLRTDKGQFFFILHHFYGASAIFDNVAAGDGGLTVGERFFKGLNRRYYTMALNIAVNSGGAWWITGDTSTAILFLFGVMNPMDGIVWATLPSYVQFIVTILLLARNLKGESIDLPPPQVNVSSFERWIILITAISMSVIPLVFSKMGLPPAFGFFILLGFMGTIYYGRKWMGAHKNGNGHVAGGAKDTLDASTRESIRKVEWPIFLVLIGLVGMITLLGELGVFDVLTRGLTYLINLLPAPFGSWIANYVLGIMSAGVENVTLAAVAARSFPYTTGAEWGSLSYYLGTGGELLAIGTLFGLLMLDKSKEYAPDEQLDSGKYFVEASKPAFIGYNCGALVNLVQLLLFA